MPAVKRRRSTRGRKRGGCLPDATAHARRRSASNQLRMCRVREAYPRLRPRIATMAKSLARASSAVAGRSRGGVSSTDKTDRPHRAGLAVPQVLRRHDRLRTSTVLTKILCIAYRTRLAERGRCLFTTFEMPQHIGQRHCRTFVQRPSLESIERVASGLVGGQVRAFDRRQNNARSRRQRNSHR
jgi:hypothetical protein